MNIFILDLDPKKCAVYHCNKHLCKMITEHNQILGSISYTARGIFKKKDIHPSFIKSTFQSFPRKDPDGNPFPYGIGYRNHPCTQWAGASTENYEWLTKLTSEMCKEYTHRYGRKHAGEEINNWYSLNKPYITSLGMTPFAQAMPVECKNTDPVKAYRDYYIKYKFRFAKWPADRIPDWWPVDQKDDTKKDVYLETTSFSLGV